MHRLLGALFLPEMPVEAKNAVLEEEFHIEMEGDRKELMRSMCNLSEGIKEQGIKLGTEQGIKLGTEQGIKLGRDGEIFSSVQEGDYSIERGAQKMNLSVPEFMQQMESAGYRIPEKV